MTRARHRGAAREGGPRRLRARLAAPDLGVALLRASSVVPAESFGPAGPQAPGIFAIGSESVIPRVGETFRRSGTLRLYLQVYGAAVEPVSQSPRFDVTFRFEHLRGGDSGGINGRFESEGRRGRPSGSRCRWGTCRPGSTASTSSCATGCRGR